MTRDMLNWSFCRIAQERGDAVEYKYMGGNERNSKEEHRKPQR
jgi:hypothetical protein